MNERGIALPIALLTLGMLMALTIAFATLSTTEPLIAGNQAKSALARTFAESGIERALWALANPTASGGVPDSLGTARAGTLAAAPYDGATFLRLSGQGGFTLAVSAGATADERDIEAVGWTPTNSASDLRPKGVRKVQTTVWRMTAPKCALCVSGNLALAGSVVIDARNNACETPPEAGTISTRDTTISGNKAKVYGPGDSTANQRPDDIKEKDKKIGTLSSAKLAMLKSLAQRSGTYYRGPQTFTGSLPSGVVFVDTIDGSPLTDSTPATSAGNVTIAGNPRWKGWLVAAGSVSLSGNADLTGLVYAQNDASLSGSVEISGAVVTENRQDDSKKGTDSTATGNVEITYNCGAVQTAGGTLSQGWFVKAGSYLEAAGQ